MPKSPYIGVTITIGYKCHSRGVITKLISHTHTCTNRKAGVLDPPPPTGLSASGQTTVFVQHIVELACTAAVPTIVGGSRGLVVKVLDSKFEGCEFKTHTGHGSFSKLRQFRLPYFASVYSAANEYKHCLEGTCDGLVSRPGESV